MEQQQRPCNFAERELLLSCYDELDSGLQQLLQEHLHGCDPCRRELARLEKTLRVLRPATLNYSAADLQRFSSRLTRHGRRRSFFPRLPVAAASLALVVLAFIAPWQSDVLRTKNSMPPAPVTVELGILEAFDFYQNLEVLELLDLFEELEPVG